MKLAYFLGGSGVDSYDVSNIFINYLDFYKVGKNHWSVVGDMF